MNSDDKGWLILYGIIFAAVISVTFMDNYFKLKEKELQVKLSACNQQHSTTTDSK